MNPERWQQIRDVLDHAIGLPDSERSAFLDAACYADLELRKEVESLLRSHQQAGSVFLKKPAIELKVPIFDPGEGSRLGRRVGVYRLVEQVGHGGMGEVYRAERADGLYDKQVAIKFVRVGLDSRSLQERFLQERQVLASLDHPNIARLLDGGTTEDGVPYLVMELVEGVPIDQYCEERDIKVDERLRLFLQVCAAVQYAHQRLVVHRDIKPSNILVSEDGVPKLLDFGIAKIVDPSGGPETTLLRPMTPEYASPEQFRGDPITTATDVYSLGVVLYRLLTGASPYSLDPRSSIEFAREVCEEEPRKPSSSHFSRPRADSAENREGLSSGELPGKTLKRQIHRRLCGDLDNIVLRAMRKQPERRYSSVEALADDLRRHLQGLPVSARGDSWSYRAGKFVTRHKVGVAASALVVMAVAGGAAATVREARIASANERRAERRFNDVRKLANSFLFEFHDAIEHLQGATPARELVVKRALEYLDSLSREAGQDASLRLELATAYEKVGNVQGAPYRDNLGDFSGALKSFQKAATLLEDLVKADPQDQDLRSKLAQEYGEIGDILDATGDLKSAMNSYQKGLAILEAIPRPNSKAKIRIETLQTRYGQGLSETGNLPKAEESFQKSITVTDELIQENPADHEDVRDKAVTCIHLAECYKKMRRLPEALAAGRTAYALLQSLVKPDNAQSSRDVDVANGVIAEILQKMGDYRGALTIHQGELTRDRISAKADPSDALLRRDVYIDYSEVAEAQSRLGETEAALANEHKAAALAEAETSKNPASVMTRKDALSIYAELAEILKKAKRNGEALVYLEKAKSIAESIAKIDPKDLDVQSDLAEVEMNLSETQFHLQHQAAAIAGYQHALATAELVAASGHENIESRILLAQLNQKLGEYYAFLAGHKLAAENSSSRQEALRWFHKSADLWNGLQKSDALEADYADRPAQIAREISEVMALSNP